jgi:hypothetical protein
MTTTTTQSAGRSVRRFIVYSLLFILVIIAGIGVSGLVGRLIDSYALISDGDSTGLALNLAFALIAGPLAVVLWWLSWRALANRDERDSVLWGLYLAGMTTVTLYTAAISLLIGIASAISGDFNPFSLANGIVWAGLWVWHRWMTRHPAKAPTRLGGGSRILCSVFGVVVGAGGLVAAIAGVLDELVAGVGYVGSVGQPWWIPVLQSLAWAIGGALVWWLHWIHDGGRRLTTGFAIVAIVLVTGLGAVVLALGGVAGALQSVLLMLFDSSRDVVLPLADLPFAIASALVGALVWAYYRREVAVAPAAARLGTALLTSGVGLAAAASGVGIIVNSILGALVTPLVETDSLRLLFGGISALVVGGPVWWLVWKPTAPVPVELARNTGRRVYLITLFGVSALVAIVTLLVIAFQVFDVGLSGSGSLVDNIRASLGLLVATALVFVYHFAVWRRDREAVGESPAVAPTITRVVLVTGADATALEQDLRELTGASVTVYRRADGETPTPDRAAIAAALEGVEHASVLVTTTAAGIEVVPLED